MWRVGDLTLQASVIIGVVNVTPDSFSDGGQFFDTSSAISHGRRLCEEGATILDVGGESTRPGADDVAIDEELARIIPVVDALARDGMVVSVDTSKAVVASEAVAAGARIINDVTALRDLKMAGVAAETGASLIVMHMQGSPRTMQHDPHYADVVTEVRDYLVDRAHHAIDAGVDRRSIAIDPGIGFGKSLDHNLELLASIDTLVDTGFPVIVGTSRKSFLGAVTGREVHQRDVATAATVALALAAGVFGVRVHNVSAAEDARRITEAIVNA